MARLQDFASITPTSSDSVLGVQSNGQGLIGIDTTLSSSTDKIPTSAAVSNAIAVERDRLNPQSPSATTGAGSAGRLVNVQYLGASDLGITSTSTPDEATAAWLKWICAHYPNTENAIFIGVITAGSKKMLQLFVYSTSQVNANGYPQYAAGTYTNYNGLMYRVGTNNYVPYGYAIS